MSDDVKTNGHESESYRLMLEEVETICKDISSPDLDLDEVVQKVERGYNLIKAMRSRLDETKTKIEQLRISFE